MHFRWWKLIIWYVILCFLYLLLHFPLILAHLVCSITMQTSTTYLRHVRMPLDSRTEVLSLVAGVERDKGTLLWTQIRYTGGELSTPGNPFAHLGKIQRPTFDFHMENVNFDWFWQNMFRFDFMFVKPRDVSPVFCFNLQTIMNIHYNSSCLHRVGVVKISRQFPSSSKHRRPVAWFHKHKFKPKHF